MRRSWASATVGGLVILVAIISYLLIRSTSERKSGSSGIAVWARFHDAAGLFEKSRVQTAGIQVGQIEKRELDPQVPTLARITVRVFPTVTLYENAVISKKSASLLGEYYLEIDPGTKMGRVKGEPLNTPPHEMRVLQDGDEIKDVREPTAMGDIMDSVGTLLPVLHDILDDVHRLTSGQITDIADNVNKLIESNADTISRLLDRVNSIAASVQGVTSAEAGDVKESIKNVREITESIKNLIGTTQGQVAANGNKVQGSIDRLQSTIDNLDKTMKNVESISERIDKGQGTLGQLVNNDAIANNVEDITENASGFVRSITKLQTIVGLRTEYNVLANTLKNYLSVQLMPRPDKFYLIELIEDPRGYQNTVLTATNSSQNGFSSTITTTTTDQLRFSLMFGKRVSFGGVTVAGRFGIKESTGGVGGDIYLFNDQLSLSVDVFNFAQASVNQYPRVKVGAAYELWNRTLYLVAGADDLLDYNRRASAGSNGGYDLFVGGMLRFNDEDLKSLLLVGGGAAAGSASK
jgi:phospholipid/cholesterol/gamma-HCH transport system substrate-binding protein